MEFGISKSCISALTSSLLSTRHPHALDTDDGLGERDKFLFDVTVLHRIVRMP